MAAERKNASDTQRREHLTLVALYEFEERANELLERLGALSIDTSEASIVRVELSQSARPTGPPALPQDTPLSPLMRSAVTGAFIGGGAALLIGVLLYEAGFLSLPFAQGSLSACFRFRRHRRGHRGHDRRTGLDHQKDPPAPSAHARASTSLQRRLSRRRQNAASFG